MVFIVFAPKCISAQSALPGAAAWLRRSMPRISPARFNVPRTGRIFGPRTRRGQTDETGEGAVLWEECKADLVLA